MSWETRGQFGDMFGGLNALFSGFAFAGVIYAILLQRRELQLQREELALTREELKRTADSHEASAALLRQQVQLAEDSLSEQRARDESMYQPVFVSRSHSYDKKGRSAGISLENGGREVRDLVLTPIGGFVASVKPKDIFPDGQTCGLNLQDLPEGDHVFQIRIAYTDLLGKRREKVVEYSPLGHEAFRELNAESSKVEI